MSHYDNYTYEKSIDCSLCGEECEWSTKYNRTTERRSFCFSCAEELERPEHVKTDIDLTVDMDTRTVEVTVSFSNYNPVAMAPDIERKKVASEERQIGIVGWVEFETENECDAFASIPWVMYADPFDSNYIRLRKNTGIYDELNDPYSMTFTWTTDGVEQERYYIRRRERFGYEFAQKKSKNVGCLLDAEEITVSFFPTNGNIFDSAIETESVPEYLVSL